MQPSAGNGSTATLTFPGPPVFKELNLANPQTFAEARAHEIWRRLRREDPVHWTGPTTDAEGRDVLTGFWSVTKYSDVLTISRDPATFSSAKGISLGGPQADFQEGTPLQYLNSMITTDPPRHVRLRRLVNKGFTPRAVAAFEEQIRQITSGILDDIAEKGECDFVTDVSALLPLAVICDMMGVPREDWPAMFKWTNMLLGSSDPEYQTAGASPLENILESVVGMTDYFRKIIEERTKDRREDLFSVLIEGEIDGERLNEQELLAFGVLLIVAGNETTRNAMTGGLLALFENPEQLEELASKPELLPTAVEEMVRWVSPVAHMARVATKDTEVRGTEIKEGQRVLMWYPSANRDEEVFPDGDVFRVDRTPNEHLAFGIGEHFCLGAGFARLEIRVMFEELLRRFPDIEQAGPADRLASAFIGGIKHLPVRFTPVAVKA
jgi:cholest-4-en-3-one 26-monooxygenase